MPSETLDVVQRGWRGVWRRVGSECAGCETLGVGAKMGEAVKEVRWRSLHCVDMSCLSTLPNPATF